MKDLVISLFGAYSPELLSQDMTFVSPDGVQTVLTAYSYMPNFEWIGAFVIFLIGLWCLFSFLLSIIKKSR